MSQFPSFRSSSFFLTRNALFLRIFVLPTKMNLLLILLLFSVVQLSEASVWDWFKDAFNWVKRLFGFGEDEPM
jgi:hypothetical protein